MEQRPRWTVVHRWAWPWVGGPLGAPSFPPGSPLTLQALTLPGLTGLGHGEGPRPVVTQHNPRAAGSCTGILTLPAVET